MIIFHGYGLLILLVSIIPAYLFRQFFDSMIAFAIIYALVIWFWGRRMNNSSNDKAYVDLDTNQLVKIKDRHSVFWINVEYWGIIIGIYIILSELKIIN